MISKGFKKNCAHITQYSYIIYKNIQSHIHLTLTTHARD